MQLFKYIPIVVTLFIVTGCSLFQPIPGVERDISPSETLSTMEAERDGAHLFLGDTFSSFQSTTYLTITDPVWTEEAVGPILYVITNTSIYKYMALTFDLSTDEKGLIVFEVERVTTPVAGLVFWTEIGEAEQIPTSIFQLPYTQEVQQFALDAADIAAHTWYEEPDSTSDQYYVLGGGNANDMLVWIIEEDQRQDPESEYNGEDNRAHLSPVISRNGNLEVEAVFTVAGGVGTTSVDRADLNGDGVCDLISFELLGHGAPVVAYARDMNGNWAFVERFWN